MKNDFVVGGHKKVGKNKLPGSLNEHEKKDKAPLINRNKQEYLQMKEGFYYKTATCETGESLCNVQIIYPFKGFIFYGITHFERKLIRVENILTEKHEPYVTLFKNMTQNAH
ncbi:hypothetical protein POVCU2_0007230 [Plasmodium ovale curtisi]|uniref:Uncharacterized protein n=1 Tax=Plasmodium ovale curtisi TaxID=864141 RepID=A0A1A8VKN4_PLAOA|nr:hypothetical protein POVCU2_0007230 [Plasmodium ovale curtisi]SBS82149.1 hypothetical protein POVCU1_006530 [Plasmodium ovale curtisi]